MSFEKEHAQPKGWVIFLEESIHYARRITSERFLVRMDSAYDSLENLHVCHAQVTDLDLERLPAGKFDMNNLVLHAGLFAYMLRYII